MNFKDDKGITLIALVITIIVLAIITSVTLYIGTELVSAAKLQTINTNMLLIKAKCKSIGELHNFDSNENPLLGNPIDINDSQYAQIKNARAITEGNTYYSFSQEDFNSKSLNEIDATEYLVNYYDSETGEVEIIYIKGFKASDGETYYKLSEILSIGY